MGGERGRGGRGGEGRGGEGERGRGGEAEEGERGEREGDSLQVYVIRYISESGTFAVTEPQVCLLNQPLSKLKNIGAKLSFWWYTVIFPSVIFSIRVSSKQADINKF